MVAGIAIGIVLTVLVIIGVVHVYNSGVATGRKQEKDGESGERDEHQRFLYFKRGEVEDDKMVN